MFSDPTPDDWLDARLRDVAAPPGLVRRLGRAVWNDEVLDAALREVAPTPALLERLAGIPLEEENSLDALLRGVPLPARLDRRLRSVAGWPISWRRWGELAVAALLVVGASLLYAGASVGLLLAVAPKDRTGPALDAEAIALRVPIAEIETDTMDVWAEEPVDESLLPTSFDPVADSLPPIRPVTWTIPNITSTPPPSINADPLIAWMAGDYRQTDPFLDTAYSRWGPVYGVHRAFDELPELDKVVGLRPRGIDPPLVPGFDWATYRLFGVFPFVSPAYPGLQKSVVPLDVPPASFETLERFLADGMLPPSGSLRTEELLSAIDYEFTPPQRGALRLHIAAGPSLFGGEGMQLLQIGVQAQRLPFGDRPPVHLTLALDASASMAWGGRLDLVRQAITEFLPRLRAEDRLSLVAFSEQARVLAEDLAPTDGELLRKVLDDLETRGSTSLGEGLRTGYAVAENSSPPGDAPRLVVLLTDGLTELDIGTVGRMEQHLVQATERNVVLEVVDLAQERVDSPQLTELARAGGGSVRHAASSDEVGWALAEIVTGQSQEVAHSVRLEVAFQPRAVQRYRLFGHEANPAADLMPSHPECELHSGQSATALYELQLSGEGGDEVAVVELTWFDPQGRPQRLVERVRRGQFAATLVDAPLSLQAATVAAETAEILRESPFALYPASAPLTWVLQVGTHLDSRLNENPSFVRFVRAVEQAAEARPYRRSQRR